jgi:hypothetical protein
MPNSRHSSSALATNWLHCSYRRRWLCAYKRRCEHSLQGARLERRGRSFVRRRERSQAQPREVAEGHLTAAAAAAQLQSAALAPSRCRRGRQGWREHCLARRSDSQKRRGRTQAAAAWSSVGYVATVPGCCGILLICLQSRSKGRMACTGGLPKLRCSP